MHGGGGEGADHQASAHDGPWDDGMYILYNQEPIISLLIHDY